MKGTIGPFSMSAAHSERTKGIPTASFGQTFNDPQSHVIDTHSFVDLGYRTALAEDTELLSRLHWGRYDYQGDYVYDFPPRIANRDGSRGRWWGAEAKLVSNRYANHKLVLGVEYRRDYQRDMFNFNIAPYEVILDDRRTGDRAGVYLQDELMLRDDLLLNAGVRYDHDSITEGTFNPRVALIHKVTAATTLKAIYGSAFRSPDAYELYYELPGANGQRANPELKAEHIRSIELIAEHHLSTDARLTASVFHNTVSDLLTQTLEASSGLLIFHNLNKASARGVELEFEKVWVGWRKLRTSYSWQRAYDSQTGTTLVNSPHGLGKLQWSTPIFHANWRAGMDAYYVGRRNTIRGETGGYWLANLTLSSLRLPQGMELSGSIYNLFDRRYADPGFDVHLQDAIQQNGRSFHIKLSYTF